MNRMNSVLKSRLHGFAMTHDGGRLFTALMSGLVLAWTFAALIATGALCAKEWRAEAAPAVPSLVSCEESANPAPGVLFRCVLTPAKPAVRDI